MQTGRWYGSRCCSETFNAVFKRNCDDDDDDDDDGDDDDDKTFKVFTSYVEKHYSEDVPVFCLIYCLIFGDEPLQVNFCSSSVKLLFLS